ncbi:MAG: DPP IV N-terminal domain-containing protein [Kiritimatiellae bacterium]|nr:DPP IV N-terminal domain-containing protein [Kiritimatiellia bacterium]MDD4736575.1 DPP IV N-terminal domain-containing protein [Kiritimatiellia bacterium]
MIPRLPIHLLLSLFLFAGPFSGSTQVLVSKATGLKASIDLSGITPPTSDQGRIFLRTLENDLKRSGWFTLARTGQGEFRLLGETDLDSRQMNFSGQLFRTAEQRALLSKTFRGPVGNPQGLAHQVADEIVEAVTGRKGIASTTIALIGTSTGKKELFLINADGGELRQLTSDHSISIAPNWLPDASGLIYTSYRKKYPDLYRINLESGVRERISKYSAMNMGGAVSPDGRLAAVVLSGRDATPGNPPLTNPELCILDLSSGKVTVLTRTPNAAEASPSWAPDGQQIVYVSDQSGSPQLYLISRNGGQPRRLTSRGTENTSPDWGPGGLIAYASRQGGRYGVHVIDPATREITTPVQDGAEYDEPTWAPDGRHLAATRSQNYSSQVYILDTMGDSPLALTKHKGDWYSPAWSPGK